MPGLAQIRAQYPQYGQLSDRQLADALHAKFYPHVPLGQFYDKIGLTSGVTQAGNGALGGARDLISAVSGGIPGFSEASAGLDALGRMGGALVHGQPVDLSRAWDQAREVQLGERSDFAAQHPIAANLAKGVGYIAQAAPFLMSGGASAAPEAVAAVRGLGARLLSGAASTARNAVTGAGIAAINGASGPGTPPQRLNAGSSAAPAGAVLGAVLPAVVAGAFKGGDIAGQVANRVSGGALISPARTALRQLAVALKADGATPQEAAIAMNGWMKSGASDPTVIDIASKLPSGGQNTLRLVRAAASSGPAAGVSTGYLDSVGNQFQDNVINRTRALTEDMRPAPVVREAAVAQRGADADSQYRAPYATTVNASPVLPALAGDAGRVGINAALKDADALRLAQQSTELGAIKTAANTEQAPLTAALGGDQLPVNDALAARIRAAMGTDAPPDHVPVSLGTLDRVKVALNEAGRQAADAGNNGRAAGYFQRAQEIDDHLAATNGAYATARDNFARSSAGIDALDLGGSAIHGDPAQVSLDLGAIMPRAAQGLTEPDAAAHAAQAALDMGGVGYRHAAITGLGAPAETSTGLANRLATSTNQGAVQDQLFGAEEGGNYREAIANEIQRLKNARYINPNTGSQTTLRAIDLGGLGEGLASAHAMIRNPLAWAISRVMAGGTLTDAERAAIAQLATSNGSGLSDRIAIDAATPKALPFIQSAAPYLAARQDHQ